MQKKQVKMFYCDFLFGDQWPHQCCCIKLQKKGIPSQNQLKINISTDFQLEHGWKIYFHYLKKWQNSTFQLTEENIIIYRKKFFRPPVVMELQTGIYYIYENTIFFIFWYNILKIEMFNISKNKKNRIFVNMVNSTSKMHHFYKSNASLVLSYRQPRLRKIKKFDIESK